MKRFAAGSLAGGLVGALLGFGMAGMFLGGSPDPAQRPVAEAQEGDPVVHAPRPAPTRLAVTGDDVEPTAPATVVAAMQELAQSSPAVAVSTGSGRIDGRIRLDDGTPMAGVRVRATREAPDELQASRRGEGPDDRTLEHEVRVAVERYWQRRANSFDAISDAEGRYAIENLPDGTYDLDAWLEGHELERRSRGEVRPDATIDFTATRLAGLTVDVRLPDGSTAERAVVHWGWQEGERSRSARELWTRDAPTLRLEPGYYEVSATIESSLGAIHEALGDMRADPRSVDLTSGAGSLTVQLRQRPGIRGRARFPDTTAQRAAIRLTRVPPGRAPDLALLDQPEKRTSVTSSDPEFAFLDLEPGTWLIGVSHTHQGDVLDHATVVVADRVVHQDLSVPKVDAGDCIIAVVLDATGQPAKEPRFQGIVRSANRSRSQSLTAIPRENGEWWLLPDAALRDALWRGEPADATVQVQVSTTFAQRKVPVDRVTRRIHVQFDATATLLVSVPGVAGTDLEDALRLDLQQTGTDGFRRREEIKADGTARIAPVEVGDYEAVLSLSRRDGGRYSSYEVQRARVAVTPGENVLTLSLPALFPLTVRSLDQPEGSVSLSVAGSRDMARLTLVDGQATFQHLPAGEYVLARATGRSHASMRVSVPAQSVVDFVRDPENAARVALRDPSGYLASAGFQEGDLIVAFGSRGFDGADELKSALLEQIASPDPYATVLRNGRTVKIAIDARRMAEGRDLGGSWSLTTR